MKNVINHSYGTEFDLFYARLCFEVLIRNRNNNEGLSQVEQIEKEFSDNYGKNSAPIMNFCLLIVEAIKIKDFQLFKMFVIQYKKCLERDGKFIEYVDRIAKYYFDETIKA